MSISRENILQEVKRTAEKNGGKPLGKARFLNETGIRDADWIGRFWARWNDVLRDAGFGPNKLNEAIDEVVLLDRYADLALELGRVPVKSELRLKKRTDPSFPSDKTYARFGAKTQLLARVYEHCAASPKHAPILPLFQSDLGEETTSKNAAAQPKDSIEGFVYLVKMGKHYKIGKTFSIPRRHRELALELPEKLRPIHAIRTDDPSGIETYWQRRFQAKCTNSEWFALSPEDVRIFKKRKFM
jgi:Meiotically up-regulated gene 113